MTLFQAITEFNRMGITVRFSATEMITKVEFYKGDEYIVEFAGPTNEIGLTNVMVEFFGEVKAQQKQQFKLFNSITPITQ